MVTVKVYAPIKGPKQLNELHEAKVYKLAKVFDPNVDCPEAID